MNPVIDLNSDLGEGAGHDKEILDLVSSANVADPAGNRLGLAGPRLAA